MPPAASGSVETDREALVALYNSHLTGGEILGYQLQLAERRSPRANGRASAPTTTGALQPLEFYGNGLSGEIPAELGSLSNLESLKLSNNGNGLSGEIPPELSSLSNLKSLELHYNRLSGEIPAELGSLWNLESLGLIYNALDAKIPVEHGQPLQFLIMAA